MQELKAEPIFLPPPQKRILNKSLIFLFTFFILILIFCFGFFFVWHQISTPRQLKAEEREFIIKKGESLNKIARNLEKEGFIKNDFYFILYVWKEGWSKKLQAGEYSLSPSMNIPQISKKLAEGDVMSREVIVTIPEGWRTEKIQEKFSIFNFQFSTINFKIKDFKEEYEFLRDAPDGTSLEGFLFPDTYKFYPEASEEEIIKKMLDNFDKKLTPELREEIFRPAPLDSKHLTGRGKTIYEIITMASLLEKEVQTFEDRQIVSGIFWKRLKEGRPLESCATIAYILNLDKWRYSIEDTRRPSPYNTYLNPGLPPGPISNPGIEAIKAAIFPKDSPYNFFLTDPQTGNTIFSKTLEEHNLNKTKYFK